MITEPLTSDDHLEIVGMLRAFTKATFSSERMRAASQTTAGYDEVAWKQMVELGWTQAGDPGDEDLGPLVQCLVHRELGARLAPSPYLATAGFAATILRVLADTEEGRAFEAELGAGMVTAAVALGPGGWSREAGEPALRARLSGTDWRLDGELGLVLDGSRAQVLVVVAAIGSGWGVFRVDPEAGGVTRSPIPTVDQTRSFGRLTLDDAAGHLLTSGPVSTDQVDAVVDRLAVLLSAEMVGASVSCLQQTLDYLGTRHQFGRPIGSFQALKHRCADMAVDLTVVQELLFTAARMMAADDTKGLRILAPLLLAQSGAAFTHTTEEAIQLHGGVGFTDELDIGHYYKRALVDAELLVATADAYARLAAVRAEAAA